MTLSSLDTLTNGAIAVDIAQARTSLWILPGVDETLLSQLAQLQWANVWNFDRSTDFATVWRRHNREREPLIVSDADSDTESFQVGSFVRLYQTPLTTKLSATLQKIKTEQLKLRAAHIGGSLFIVGDIERHSDDVSLVLEMAPQLRICLVPVPSSSGFDPGSISKTVFLWSAGLDRFIEAFRREVASTASADILDLKDAKGLKISRALFDEIGTDWMLLTRQHTAASAITQEGFDRFLNGDPAWAIYAAGGAYPRALRAPESGTGADRERRRDTFGDELLEIVRTLDQREVDPRDALRQVLVFAEPGSGVTTLLRQLSVLTAQAGYPTFLSKPLPKDLTVRSLGRAVGAVQDLWWEHRKGRGTGAGRIPAVILIDKDAESVTDLKVLAKSLSALGREVVLVRALERTRDEMRKARGVYTLSSEVEEHELLALGRHLRDFADQHSLAPIPSEGEWLAYHQGLNQISRYSPAIGRTDFEDVPHLFLIGIQPFVSERISDVNSLEQYYFQRWDGIGSVNLKAIVHTVAAAGVFNLGIPYNALRRHADLDLSELETPHSDSHRIIDTFLEWRTAGTNLQNWYLRIRHPLVGRLLCRGIDPIEGQVPFRPILGVLSQLTTKPDDLWFAETLAFRIGQQFTANSPGFSLETDTPMQKAARAIFGAIPQPLKEISRPIAHHEARYHIHVIHACLAALRQPQTTTLSLSQVQAILDSEMSRSGTWLDRALQIRGSLEPDSNILNTYARLKFAYAEAFRGRQTERFRDAFEQGLDLQERAIEGDSTNGYALYQFVQQIIEAAPNAGDSWSSDRQLELLSRAEARLAELLRLHQEHRWRNIDPIDAEVQLGTLLASHLDALSKIPNLENLLAEFRVRHPEAALRILIRLYVGRESFDKVFRNAEKARHLRELRRELFEIPNKTPRGLLYLYRLFIADPQGRLEFKPRLDILTDLKRKSSEQFLPYWHDEASLLCQLDNLHEGAQRFAELRAFRQAQEAQWFWLNERLLLTQGNGVHARLMTLVVVNPNEGWANFQNTNIRLRYQPQQFALMSRNQPFRAYIRFTIYGLQAIPEQWAQQDLRALGIE